MYASGDILAAALGMAISYAVQESRFRFQSESQLACAWQILAARAGISSGGGAFGFGVATSGGRSILSSVLH